LGGGPGISTTKSEKLSVKQNVETSSGGDGNGSGSGVKVSALGGGSSDRGVAMVGA